MRRCLCCLIALLAFTGIACPPAPSVDPQKTNDTPEDKPVPVPESLDALRPRLEAALQQVRDRDLLTSHGFWTVFHGILGMGPEKATLKDPKTKERHNAIEYICQGKELRGLKFIPTADGL
ncbi:MAG: hypothetical protein HY289_11275, partial [Planctomycetes bacterium]|nr:hypothetical protein [Planctomycetota bacterium]